ncbi:hypothetical protein GCM10012275_31120 [Longimycelium tulufanense]|uniref:Uncharacterized protein n=1 Tax=Longimycelium tulufanense TaxID=907463 RepID=A0A8J3CEQ9_9PSEU|nr:hypothetical protein [Longimycelium tulufanense]GGM57690.1 hypothetical protein GCM10012275_31120 [Longimycelium tulufanense]
MGLHATTIGRPLPSLDKSDEYVPTSIEWNTGETLIEPAYYFIEDRQGGSEAGYVEIAVDLSSGLLRRVVVLKKPTPGKFLRVAELRQVPVLRGSLHVHTSPWTEDGRYTKARNSLKFTMMTYEDQGDLSVYDIETGRYISFFNQLPEKFVMSGSAGFGISSDQKIVGIRIEKVEERRP